MDHSLFTTFDHIKIKIVEKHFHQKSLKNELKDSLLKRKVTLKKESIDQRTRSADSV